MTAKKKPPPAAPASERTDWARAHTNLALADLDKNLAEWVKWRRGHKKGGTPQVAALIVSECADRLEHVRLFTERGTP